MDVWLWLFRELSALERRLWRATYRRLYLRSAHWLRIRQAAIERAGRRCQECGGRHRLQVHHRTYAHLGAEQPGDLEVLCAFCHAERHALRAAITPAGERSFVGTGTWASEK